MKLSELRLDTVYADHEGRPLMLLSLDKYAKPKATYGTRRIRFADAHDKSFGVLILRHGYASQPTDFDDLSKVAAELRASLPEKEQIVARYDVKVEALRLITETWQDHRARRRAEGEARHRANVERARIRKIRAERIGIIEKQLPDGVRVRGLSEHSDHAQVSLEDLVSLLSMAAPVPAPEGTAVTPRERSLLAAGFDAAVASLRYEDGSSVDVAHVKNPYRPM